MNNFIEWDDGMAAKGTNNKIVPERLYFIFRWDGWFIVHRLNIAEQLKVLYHRNVNTGLLYTHYKAYITYGTGVHRHTKEKKGLLGPNPNPSSLSSHPSASDLTF